MGLTQLAVFIGFICFCSIDMAAGASVGQAVPIISWADRLQWLLALVVVLGMFFLCIWLFRKMSAVHPLSKHQQLHIVTGISLGIREKVVVVQTGAKQLVLAVTPGRIQTLTILEDEDCLENPLLKPANPDEISFAQKLMQAIKGQSDA